MSYSEKERSKISRFLESPWGRAAAIAGVLGVAAMAIVRMRQMADMERLRNISDIEVSRITNKAFKVWADYDSLPGEGI